MPPLVCVTEPCQWKALEWLASHCTILEAGPPTPEFQAASSQIQGLVIRTATKVDEALLQRLPSLKVIGRAGVGLDNIDCKACARRSIAVVHTPNANTQAVVECVIGLLCDALRPRTRLQRAVDYMQWETLREAACGNRQLNECTLGILGFGRIGSRVATVAHAIGMKVVFHDLLPIPAEATHRAKPVSATELFACSDVISLHIDGRESNRHFVNASLVRSMKSDVLLINTSRGMVLDHEALSQFLRSNPAATAMLDVHDPEPFSAQHPLLGLSNALLYPHIASRTRSATDNMSWVVRDVVAVLQGRKPSYPAPMI